MNNGQSIPDNVKYLFKVIVAEPNQIADRIEHFIKHNTYPNVPKDKEIEVVNIIAQDDAVVTLQYCLRQELLEARRKEQEYINGFSSHQNKDVQTESESEGAFAPISEFLADKKSEKEILKEKYDKAVESGNVDEVELAAARLREYDRAVERDTTLTNRFDGGDLQSYEKQSKRGNPNDIRKMTEEEKAYHKRRENHNFRRGELFIDKDTLEMRFVPEGSDLHEIPKHVPMREDMADMAKWFRAWEAELNFYKTTEVGKSDKCSIEKYMESRTNIIKMMSEYADTLDDMSFVEKVRDRYHTYGEDFHYIFPKMDKYVEVFPMERYDSRQAFEVAIRNEKSYWKSLENFQSEEDLAAKRAEDINSINSYFKASSMEFDA